MAVKGAIGDPISKSVRVVARPNVDEVRDYLDEYYGKPGINYSLWLGLKTLEITATETSSYFDFNGIYKNHVDGEDDEKDYSDFQDTVWAVVADCLNAIPGFSIPSSVFNILEKMVPKPKLTTEPNIVSMILRGNSLYEGIEHYGAGFEIAVTGNASGTPGSGVVNCYGKATYVVSVYLAPDGSYTYYLDDEDTDQVTVRVFQG